MLDETKRKLSRRYESWHLDELERIIESHPVIGWPKRGHELREWAIGITYPYLPAKPGAVGSGWAPTPQLIKALQRLFQSEDFSVLVRLSGPNITAIEER